MSDVHTYSSDVAFTPAVKAIQTRKGSREGYAHVEARGGRKTPQVGHGNKGLHGIDPVHPTIAYSAIVKCQCLGLFKLRERPF